MVRRRRLVTLGAVAFAAMAVGCRHRPSGDVTSGGVRIRQLPNGTQITGDESLLFETGKATVKPEGMVFLNKLARVLRDKPQAVVQVEGHTDSVGSAPMNQVLSEKRALSVRQALIDRGVPASRIASRGLGMTQPVGDNSTPEGRASNRRTEIFVSGDTIESLD